MEMKARFWKVQKETYTDGTVKAAVLGSRLAFEKPSDNYYKDQWREVFVCWFDSDTEARGAVLMALSKKAWVAA
jgi:hypothetical protein